VISAAENSNKFQKTRFCKEKLVEDMVTLGPTAQATLVSIKYILFLEFDFSCGKLTIIIKIRQIFLPKNWKKKKKTLVLECGPHQKFV
jgi:hypothetical protein